jgi:putative transcriptional regulator
MLMQKTNFNNYFLIAMPAISESDSTFAQAVIFLCEHSDDGAMGIIINKPLNVTLGSVLQHLDIESNIEKINNIPIYMGGPVGQEHGFVIHEPYRDDEQDDDLVISASRDTLADIANDEGPLQYFVSLGYTGWEAGQLEEEISHNDWLMVPYSKEIIFDTPIEQRWRKAIELLGIDIAKLSSHVGHA